MAEGTFWTAISHIITGVIGSSTTSSSGYQAASRRTGTLWTTITNIIIGVIGSGVVLSLAEGDNHSSSSSGSEAAGGGTVDSLPSTSLGLRWPPGATTSTTPVRTPAPIDLDPANVMASVAAAVAQTPATHCCSHCRRVFTNARSLSLHMRVHPGDVHFCRICSLRFSNITSFREHLVVHLPTSYEIIGGASAAVTLIRSNANRPVDLNRSPPLEPEE